MICKQQVLVGGPETCLYLYVLSEGNGWDGLWNTLKDKGREGVSPTGRVRFDIKLFSSPMERVPRIMSPNTSSRSLWMGVGRAEMRICVK